MLDTLIAVIVGIMLAGLVIMLGFAKAEKDMRKPEKRKSMQRLQWYKQHKGK